MRGKPAGSIIKSGMPEVPSDNVTQQSLLLGRTVVQAEYTEIVEGGRKVREATVRLSHERLKNHGHTHVADTDEAPNAASRRSHLAAADRALQKARDSRDGRLDVSELIAASENRRTGTVRALSQYQRMAVAADSRAFSSRAQPAPLFSPSPVTSTSSRWPNAAQQVCSVARLS